jgi:hypothetical protein
MAVKLSALRTGRYFTPQKYYFYASGIHFCFITNKIGLQKNQLLYFLMVAVSKNKNEIRHFVMFGTLSRSSTFTRNSLINTGAMLQAERKIVGFIPYEVI